MPFWLVENGFPHCQLGSMARFHLLRSSSGLFDGTVDCTQVSDVGNRKSSLLKSLLPLRQPVNP
jgi:hypothetical protein